jgi:hypothetical protein
VLRTSRDQMPQLTSRGLAGGVARGALGHAPAAAARAEAPALARERHQPLEHAVPAPQTRETVGYALQPGEVGDVRVRRSAGLSSGTLRCRQQAERGAWTPQKVV